jgi:signal transduction histidine kinase
MVRPGLPPNLSRKHAYPPLAADTPALRVDVQSSRITEANPALAELLASRSDDLVGRPLAELWLLSERDTLMQRFRDVILRGHDAFGAVELRRDQADPVWVEVDATYRYHGGQRLEIVLSPVDPPTDPPADPPIPEPWIAPGASTWLPVAMTTLAAVRPMVEGHAPSSAVWHSGGQTDDTSVFRFGDRRARISPAQRRGGPETASGAPVAACRLALDALQLAGAAALRVGADAMVVDATPAAEQLLDQSELGLCGCTLDSLVHMPGAAMAALKAARCEGSRQSVLASSARTGTPLVIEWLPSGEPGGGIAVLAASRPEDDAAERLRFQSQLVSLVAHDVRDSLAAVYSGLRTVADGLAAGDPLHLTVERALSESQRAHRIVEDALAMARPGNLVGIELDLDTVVHQTVARFRARASARAIELSERLESGCHVLADLSSLERAFSNLVENALDAMPLTGEVVVATAREDRGQPGVLVTISDTGIGIKEETRPNIFEPFYTDKDGGTGLGLAITRHVVLDHGGQISFETEEGRGTTFHLWLPRIEADRA